MVVYICKKFHNNILNGFQLTEWIRVHSRNGYFQYLLCSKGHNSKSRLSRVMLLCSACCLMVLYICEKFSHNISNSFQPTERTKYTVEMAMFNVHSAVTPKVGKPELLFMCSAHRLMELYTCVKFRANISEGISYGADTNDGSTDGQVYAQNFEMYNKIPLPQKSISLSMLCFQILTLT